MSDPSIRPIGFVGLGLMGAPMATNLMRAGHRVMVHNRSRTKADQLGRRGAIVAPSLPGMAEECDIVFTMLPSTAAVEQTVTGDEGLFSGIRPGTLVIDMSTISPMATRSMGERLKEKGAAMLDAPVSGGDIGAIEGTLSIMVGGDAADFARALPLFHALGRTVVHVGGAGAGQVTKAANQVVVGLIMAGIAEAITLATRGGVATDRLLDVLGGGLAANRVMVVKREKYLGRDFTPGGRSELHLKDLGIALAVARELGLVLPHTALLEQLFQAMKQKGRGGEDHAALIRVIEDLSGAGSDGARSESPTHADVDASVA